MADIFISYARGDRDRVEKLAAALEREGWSVWWDRHIEGGAAFAKTIEEELNAAKVAIVAWSQASLDSDWVKDEAVTAREQAKLIPISIDGTPSPMGFKQYHAIDFSVDEATALADLKRSLANKLSASNSTQETAGVPPPAASTGARFSDPKIIAVAAALLLGIAFLVFVFVRQPDTQRTVDSDSAETVTNSVEQTNNLSSTPNAHDNSIAVLAFSDFSPAGDQEYFADGISEELLNVLSRVEGLRVASRTSAFSFKGTNTAAPEIASALNVSHVLEGSVRKAGDTLRITAQLIDGRNDEHIWSETYDRALTAENIFAIQDEISEAIVQELQGKLVRTAHETTLKTASTEAYDAYLRGKALTAQRTRETLNAGRIELDRAIEIDPNFAPAHQYLVEAHLHLVYYAGADRDEGLDQAEKHLARAIALAPESADTHLMSGLVAFWKLDYFGAIEHFKKAIAVNPNSMDAHRRLGLTYIAVERHTKAAESLRTALSLDPLSPIVQVNALVLYVYEERIDELLNKARENVEQFPDFESAWATYASILWNIGDVAKAYEIWVRRAPSRYIARQYIAESFWHLRRNDLAEHDADSAIKAAILMEAGEKERAIEIAMDEDELFGIEVERLLLLISLGEDDVAYEKAREDIARRRLLSDDVDLSPASRGEAATYFAILKSRNDPDAEIFRKRLRDRYEGHSPEDFAFAGSFYAAAMWRMTEGDGEGALLWLNAIADRNIPWRYYEFVPFFDPIRGTEGYKKFDTRMKNIAARHLEEIAAVDPDWDKR